jgi:hypothetical protein
MLGMNLPTLPPTTLYQKWAGVKTIHKISADKKSSEWEMWIDTDPFSNDGEPKNNWKLAATYIDYGVPRYNNIPLTWQCHKDLGRVVICYCGCLWIFFNIILYWKEKSYLYSMNLYLLP